jgi:hypothetical protein
MKPVTIIFLIFLLLSFISGIYFCATHEVPVSAVSIGGIGGIEGLETTESSNLSDPTAIDCPDMLIKSGNALLLYNSTLPENPGINPMPFYSLDEYINYLEIQRAKGIHCPVLFLQEENNTQGQSVYRIRPDVFNQEGGLPNSRPMNYKNFKTASPDVSRSAIPIIDSSDDYPPWNIGGYSGFDPMGLHIGQYTTLDALHDSTYKGQSLSENPMDDNWGGVLHTKAAVDSGKYDENEVAPPSASGPMVEKSDNIRHQKFASQKSIFA